MEERLPPDPPWLLHTFDMSPAPLASDVRPTFDSVGHLIQLTESEIHERNRVALAAIEAIEQIGDASEQRETLDYLMRAVDDDRLSARRRFGP